MNEAKLPKSLNRLDSFLNYAKRSLEEDQRIHGIACQDETLKDVSLKHLDVHQSRFMSIQFDHCDFEKASFVDCIFERCDLSNSKFKAAYFERCAFIECKAIGCDLSSSSMKHIHYRESNLKYTFFEQSHVEYSRFDHCELTEASFAGVIFKQMEMLESRFIRNNFFKTSLQQIDFTSCDFIAPVVSDQQIELKGIIVNSMQALDLVSLWGITIKE